MTSIVNGIAMSTEEIISGRDEIRKDSFAKAPTCDLIRVEEPHSDLGDFGAHVFDLNGGIAALESVADIRRMPKEYSTPDLMREIAETTDDAFYVVDLSVVMAKINKWRELMPRVKPFYAIKCNNDAAICQMLASAGCGFDCASQAEIQQALDMGVAPERVIYANPCKQLSMLRYARSVDVRLMTADNLVELEKIAKTFPEARIIMRIAVDDSKSVCRFNSKFGAPQHEWAPFLRRASELGLDVVGVSFHVGSGCQDVGPFGDAVASARAAFDLAEMYGFHPTILDCGGGYPGTDSSHLSFHDVAATVSAAVDLHFPEGCGVDIIAEPGRYISAASHSYAVSVIAKRQLSAEQLADASAIEAFGARAGPEEEEAAAENEESFETDTSSSDSNKGDQAHAQGKPRDAQVALYINDGVYGSFNCVVFDHAVVEPRVLTRSGVRNAGQRFGSVPTKLFGPTCDSIDVVMSCTELPSLEVGDWLYFPDMGSYTRCAASRFNGQGIFAVHYVWSA